METLEKKGSTENCVAFLRFLDINVQSTYSILLPLLWALTTQEILNINNIPLIKVNHNFFQNSFFPSAVIEWSTLDLNIRNSESLNIFKKTLLNFICPARSPVFNCHNPKGVELLTRLRLGHLREHKFKHSSQDSLNPVCSCGNDIETSAHFLFHCPNFWNWRSLFLNIIGSIDRNILTRNDSQVTETLLYGNSNSNNITNNLILNATIDFRIATKRFDTPLCILNMV